MMELSEKNKF